MDIKKTSEQWYEEMPKETRPVIMDPDGWDRRNYQYSFYEEEITHNEFVGRLMMSTCLMFLKCVSCKTNPQKKENLCMDCWNDINC